jgi:D-alanyl-D-alanine carboxypeptidase/D-alanyl-D-alanine-endopeptidase (penicillin-binding protein 4)
MLLDAKALTTPRNGKDDVDCVRSPGSNVISIQGHYPLGKKTAKFRCAVNDPDAYTLGVFAEALKSANISVEGAARGGLPPNSPLDAEDRSPLAPPLELRYAGAKAVWAHESRPLLDIIRKMMPPSDNFIADDLFKLLPTRALHQRGSFAGGAEVERKFIASLGLDPRTLDNGDGSGLSQGNRITPRALATLLRWEAASANGWAFIHALGRPGINGTVRRHLRGTDAVGRVWAKDGYIWHVSTFSGYAYTRRHGLAIFSIMFNNASGRIRPYQNAQDEIVRAIVDMP